MPRRRAIFQMVLIGVVVGIAMGGVAYFIPWLPAPASKEAEAIDAVYWFVAIICSLIFAVVAGVSVYAGWKFRAAPDDTEDGAPIHGHTGLEITWTVIPTILVTAMSVYSGVVLTQIERVSDDDRVVKVTAQQFAWRFEYGDEKLTTGELVLPIDKTVKLELTAEDVIHSFWVPEWRVKKDAVPGITTEVIVTPTKEGRFPVICTELCGLGHAAMRARAVVVSEEEFRQWVADQKRLAATAASVQGKQLFAAQCGSCHALADAGTTAETGPNLDTVLPGKNAEYVREQIVNPNSQITAGFQPDVMPQDFGEQLSEPQIDSLVEYLLEVAGKR
jgi:cytochrome c oxidase subunit II